MAKPFLLLKQGGGIYYVKFRLDGGGYSSAKSTRTSNLTKAYKIASNWLVNGVPEKDKKGDVSTQQKLSCLHMLSSLDFSEKEIQKIVNTMKSRGYIISAVTPKSAESRPLEPFLLNFWDYDNSPYVKEKELKGQSIHKSYCATMTCRVKKYWVPRLSGRCIGDIVLDDIKAIFDDETVTSLAHKTINGIVSAITVPLKWAYFNHLTYNNCFDGIIKCSQKGKKRKILSVDEACAVFNVPWENDSAKLANALAMATGMRQGEIAALQKRDIGMDRIYVRHSWSSFDGLKNCKNGEEREAIIPPSIRDALLEQVSMNPYEEGEAAFVFFGQKPAKPTDPQNWLKFLHRALELSGYESPKEICFHSWRHFWCSRMLDVVKDKRVVMLQSGHKTETMLDHYASHLETEVSFEELRKAEDKVFLPIFSVAEDMPKL